MSLMQLTPRQLGYHPDDMVWLWRPEGIAYEHTARDGVPFGATPIHLPS